VEANVRKLAEVVPGVKVPGEKMIPSVKDKHPGVLSVPEAQP
jgi:hypothetical protein